MFYAADLKGPRRKTVHREKFSLLSALVRQIVSELDLFVFLLSLLNKRENFRAIAFTGQLFEGVADMAAAGPQDRL